MFVWHSVKLPTLGSACVSLCPRSRSAELRIRKSTKQHSQACSVNCDASEQKLPNAFNPRLSSERIATVCALIFDLDVAATKDFREGRLVKKSVPFKHPPARIETACSDLWKTRQSTGALVRPMLLCPPECVMLRPFQKQGVDWLLQTESGILADEMGLGKTIEAIAAMRWLIHEGHVRWALIVCPRSLLANWEEEIAKWAPEVSRVRVTPKASHRDEAWRLLAGRAHVLLTNYEQLRNPPATLKQENIDLIIADEAHRARNISAQITQGLRCLKRKRFWALTGTPIERDSDDLATLLSTIQPRRFSLKQRSLHHTQLRSFARKYVLRRHRENVLKELPGVVEHKQVLDLLPQQQTAYRRAIRELAVGESDQRLRIINKLRRICDYDEKSRRSSKVERITEIITNVARVPEKAVVFSYLLEPLEILHEAITKQLGGDYTKLLVGSMDLPTREATLKHFKKDPQFVALLCSLRVGGEGLTLTEANHVVFINEWWNPSSNAQARDRVVRIGQRKGVFVYKFRCRNTIEDVLEETLKTKTEITRTLIDRLAEPVPGADPKLNSFIDKLTERLL